MRARSRRADLQASPPQRSTSRQYSATSIVLIDTASIFGRIATDPRFENSALMVIILNAAYIGIDLDHNDPLDEAQDRRFFTVSDHLFCSLFSAEILVRIFAHKEKRHFLLDPGLRR